MDEATRFETARPRLRAVALRMLGSAAEAEDAVQEAWLRLNRADGAEIVNLDAWLTTVLGRICLDMLRSRTSRREEEYTGDAPAPAAGPEQEVLLADSVGLALLVVLETLTPVERLAFVLHDLFGVAYDEIAPIVGRSPEAARQLASRARRRVRQNPAVESPADRRIVDAFLAAARGGDLGTLLTLLDPDVRMRADGVVARVGSAEVAAYFNGKAQIARPALLDGAVGILVATPDHLIALVRLTIDGDRITGIDAITDPAGLATVAVVPLR